ncbi:MAG: hypothetical protein JRI68_27895 [Deltaproteobacteria bacterium]|nr:hypothetical protein [Deltaproteobacteria bacterium]
MRSAVVLALVSLVGCTPAPMPKQRPVTDQESTAEPDAPPERAAGCSTAGSELELVASQPVETNLTGDQLPDTHQVWLAMIDGAARSLDIEQFYLANRPGGRLEPILQAIERAADRGVQVRLIADADFADKYPDPLTRLGRRATVRTIDLTETMGGVQHAKYFIVDDCEVYLGSANFDWRSLEHIHELGLRIRSPRLVAALAEVFELDWQLAGGRTPGRNRARSWDGFPVALDGDHQVRPAFSPRGWLPDDRSWDLPLLTEAIENAKRTVRVQLLTYQSHFRDGAPFPALDETLRAAAGRGVTVRLMVSHWQQRSGRIEDVQALVRDSTVEAKLITIPEHSRGFIPFARVIQLARQLETIFDGLWNGPYATTVDPEATYPEPRIGP